MLLPANLKSLSHPDALVRKSAARALAATPSVDVVPHLQRALLEERDMKVVRWLAYGLGKGRNTGSVPYLEAVERQLSDPEARDWITVSKEIILQTTSPSAQLRMLRSTSSTTKHQGAVLARAYADRPLDVVKQLERNCASAEPTVRRWSALALGYTRGLRTAPAVIECLEDSDFLVREWAAWSISRIRDATAFPKLVEKLSDPNARVREWVARAVAALPNPSGPGLLIASYYTEKDAMCRESLLHALQPHAGAHTEAIRTLLVWALKKEEEPIIRIALLDLVNADPKFLSDPEILEYLAGFAESDIEGFLSLRVTGSLALACSKQESRMLRRVLRSPRLRTLVKLLSRPESAKTDSLAIGCCDHEAKGKQINLRMIARLQVESEALYWSARKWANALSCAVSTIHGTPTWKRVCGPARARARLARKMRQDHQQGRSEDA